MVTGWLKGDWLGDGSGDEWVKGDGFNIFLALILSGERGIGGFFYAKFFGKAVWKEFLDKPSGKAEQKEFLDKPSGKAERKKLKKS